MKISTTKMFKHRIIAPTGYIFHESMLEEYKKVLGDEKVTIGLGGNLLTFTELHFNTLDDTNIDWETFMDNNLTPLMVKA